MAKLSGIAVSTLNKPSAGDYTASDACSECDSNYIRISHCSACPQFSQDCTVGIIGKCREIPEFICQLPADLSTRPARHITSVFGYTALNRVDAAGCRYTDPGYVGSAQILLFYQFTDAVLDSLNNGPSVAVVSVYGFLFDEDFPSVINDAELY